MRRWRFKNVWRTGWRGAGLLVLGLAFAQVPAGVTFDTRVASNDGSGEPEVAVNALNPANLVVAHMPASRSRAMAGPRGTKRHFRRAEATQPWLRDGAGRFYAAYLPEQNGAPVFVSADGGRTWTRAGDPLHGSDLPVAPGAMEINPQGPVYMGPWATVACDREFRAADRSTGTLYASCADHGDACGGESASAWELSFLACRANGFSSAILTDCGRRYIVSHDHGQTWSGWFPEDSPDYPVSYTGAFAGIPTAARGVLATAYVAGRAKGSSCGPCAVFETSPGGGAKHGRAI